MDIKVGFQLPDFSAYADFFAKEHAHWGEKIKRINFRHTRKVKCNATFFRVKKKCLLTRIV